MNSALCKMSISLVATAVLLESCSTNDSRSFQNLSAERANYSLRPAIYSANRCPSDGDEEFAFALIPLVASFGAPFIVNAVGQAINDYKDGLSGQFLATGVLNPHDFDEARCIIISYGLLGPPLNSPNSGKSKPSIKTMRELGLADQPIFYMEIKVDVLDEQNRLQTQSETSRVNAKSIILRPVLVTYSDTIARSRGSGSKNVTAILALSRTPIAEIDDKTSFAIFRFNLGKLEAGSYYEDNTGTSILRGTASSQPFAADFSNASINAAALVTDSEEPSIALQALVSTYDAKKGDLQKAIDDAIKKALGNAEKEKGENQ